MASINLSGPVSVCVDRPLLSVDRPFTYELPVELRAGVGSLVSVLFHGKAVKGWVLGPTDDLPRQILPVRKVRGPVRFFDERMLDLLRWVSERYVAPLASVIARSHPPRVASEESVGRGGDAEGVAGSARGPAALRSAGHAPPSPRSAKAAGPTAGSPVIGTYKGGEELAAALAGASRAVFLSPGPAGAEGV